MTLKRALAAGVTAAFFTVGCGSPELPEIHPLRADGRYPPLTPETLIEAIHAVRGAERYQVQVNSIDGDEADVLLNGEALTLHMFWHVGHWHWWTATISGSKRWSTARSVVHWFSRGKPPPQ